MKKIILPFIIFSLFVLPQKLSAQEGVDCRKIFDQDMKNCSTDFNSCQASCSDKTKKPDGSLYINSGGIFSTCVKESDCHGKNSACGNQSLETYRICVRSGKQPETSEAKQVIPQQESKFFTQSIDDWIMENHLEYNPQNIAPKPSQLQEKMFQKAREEWKSATKYMGEERQSTFEFLWEGEWPNVKAVVIDKESGIILQSDEWGKPYVQELADEATNKVMSPFLESSDEFTKRVIFQQGDMEIKVINANPTKNKVSVEVDDFFDIFVIQTHFRVDYDLDKKTAQVDVYEGEVSIKTKDGKMATIKPNGDKPGVLLITKKRNLTKLALVGGLAVAIVGVFFRQIRRMSDRQSHKKRPERLPS